MGCNASKREIRVWNDSTANLQDFDVCKSRSTALMEDYDTLYQNGHSSAKLGPLSHVKVQKGRTRLLNLPRELAGISEPAPFPRFPTKLKEQDNHKSPRNQETRQARKPVFIESQSHHRENRIPTLRPDYKADKRSHHHPVAAQPRVHWQLHPARDSRSRPLAQTQEQPSHRTRDLGRPTPQHCGRERDQVKKHSIERYSRASPREKHSGRPHRTQRIHEDTVQPSPRLHRRKIEVHDWSPLPKRVDKKSSATQLRYTMNPYTTFKQEPEVSFYYPKISVLNIYV